MTGMIIRKSTYNDIDRLLEIYEEARQFMKVTGNPDQWAGGYPKKSMLLEDIEKANSYVCIMDGMIVSVFYFEIGEDPTYKEIFNGQWLNHKPYGVVHRIASARSSKGVGAFCLEWCYDQIGNIRIDTHKDNIPMQNLLIKKGYKRCGIIYVSDGTQRIAYQKTSK